MLWADKWGTAKSMEILFLYSSPLFKKQTKDTVPIFNNSVSANFKNRIRLRIFTLPHVQYCKQIQDFKLLKNQYQQNVTGTYTRCITYKKFATVYTKREEREREREGSQEATIQTESKSNKEG